MANRTWNQLKSAAKEAAGSAWVVTDGGDARYLTFTDTGTGRTVQAYHADGKTVVSGSTCTIREAAARLAGELERADRFGGLGSFDRLRRLAEPKGKPGRRVEGQVVSIRLPKDILAALDSKAAMDGTSRAGAARAALRQALT